MADNLLDLALLLEVSKSLAGQAAVDLQTVDEGGDGDQAVGLDILVETLGSLLLKDDGVLGLVLNCSRVSHAVPYISHPVFSCFNSNTTPPAHSLKQLKEIFAVFDRSEGGSLADNIVGYEVVVCIPFPLDHFLRAGACVE